jgi:hypothetical protein
MVFSSREKLLDYYQYMNPHARSLRIKVLYSMDRRTELQVLNHNTPMDGYYVDLTEVEVDVTGSGESL